MDMRVKMLYCEKGNHIPHEVIFAAPDYGRDEKGNLLIMGANHIIGDCFGNVSNVYMDGTVGVPEEERELAEEDSPPICRVHNYECVWRYWGYNLRIVEENIMRLLDYFKFPDYYSTSERDIENIIRDFYPCFHEEVS